MQTTPYLEPTQASGAALFQRGIKGEVIMLNLLRLRKVADYGAAPELQPDTSISGKEAFQLYVDHTLPFLEKSGGEIMLIADGGAFFIGPQDERWDIAMLLRQTSVESFFSFAADPDCMAGIGHRTAAILDSRLLPLAQR